MNNRRKRKNKRNYVDIRMSKADEISAYLSDLVTRHWASVCSEYATINQTWQDISRQRGIRGLDFDEAVRHVLDRWSPYVINLKRVKISNKNGLYIYAQTQDGYWGKCRLIVE